MFHSVHFYGCSSVKRVIALGEKGFCGISQRRPLYAGGVGNFQTQWVKKGTSPSSEFTPLYISAPLMRQVWVYSLNIICFANPIYLKTVEKGLV